MFEVKKIGDQWLIRPTGCQFRQLKIPSGACHVEVSDNFLLVDDTVYEIKASGNVAYVEKLQSIAIAEERNAIYSKGGETSEETMASRSFEYVENLQGISIAEESDESTCSTSNTVAECEKGAGNNLSLEMEDGQTEYDSLEAGQTEETNVIETIKGDAKELNVHSPSGAEVKCAQPNRTETTCPGLSEKNSKGFTSYKVRDNMHLKESNFKKDDVRQTMQTTQTDQDASRVLNSNKSNFAVYGKAEVDRAASNDVEKFLFPTRKTKTKSSYMCITNENIVVKVYVDDISKLPVDCIVNDADTNLDHREGLAKRIATEAGAEFVRESFEYVKYYGNLKVGSACKTTAGNLRYKFVIHVVGPCWEFCNPYNKQDVQRCERDLYNAILSSLCLAEKHDAKTVALPTISSGDFPKEIGSVQYARAILDYSRLAKHPLSEIHIVDLNEKTIDVFKQTFQKMIPGGKLPDFYRPVVYEMSDKRQASYIAGDSKKAHRPSSAQTTHVTDQRVSNNYDIPSIYPYAENGITSQGSKTGEFIVYLGRDQELHIYTGDILLLPNVDIIVCGNDKNGKSLGGLAMALSEKCRDPYKKDVKRQFKTPRHPGDIVFISSKGLTNVKWIAHAVPFTKADCKTREESMRNVTFMYEKILNGLKDKGCHSLALPLIGTGKGKVNPDFHCKCLLEAFESFCGFNKTFKFTIHLVHWDEENTRTAIECVEQKFRESPCHVDRRPANQNLLKSTLEESSMKANENRKL